jgi:hypothetical protein
MAAFARDLEIALREARAATDRCGDRDAAAQADVGAFIRATCGARAAKRRAAIADALERRGTDIATATRATRAFRWRRSLLPLAALGALVTLVAGALMTAAVRAEPSRDVARTSQMPAASVAMIAPAPEQRTASGSTARAEPVTNADTASARPESAPLPSAPLPSARAASLTRAPSTPAPPRSAAVLVPRHPSPQQALESRD